LDAVAVGQVTPGPVFTTATFIGYVLHGGSGALVATLGVFLPHSSSSPLTAPLLPKLRSSPTAGHIVDGINVASLALIGVVTWQLGRAAIVDSRLCLLQSLVQFFCRRSQSTPHGSLSRQEHSDASITDEGFRAGYLASKEMTE